MNKRIAEASALRGFFEEQLKHLQQLFKAHQSNKLQQQSEAERISSAIETILKGTDIRLRAIGNYQKRLRKSARELLDYLEYIVANMPPPVKVSGTAYSNNSLVNTIFPSAIAMHRLFSRSVAVRNFFNSPENLQRQEVFALLFLNRTEKNIIGAEIRGAVILRDVAQTSIHFSDHQLIAPQATEEEARGVLKKTS